MGKAKREESAKTEHDMVASTDLSLTIQEMNINVFTHFLA